jgi:hypothetical protein
MALPPTRCSQVIKSMKRMGEVQIKAMIVALFQGRSFPPHWRANRRQQIEPKDRIVPTRSSSRNLPNGDGVSVPAPSCVAMGGLTLRMKDMASRESPPIGRLM